VNQQADSPPGDDGTAKPRRPMLAGIEVREEDL